MSSDIQFGDLEQAEPQKGLRPDQDAHFATALVGKVGPEELLIFVDLDVMRDMEAHALSNTRVELGGVMLGQQLIDDQGRPFVVITDSLRAEHYEATKGSFKFTHETWAQITRQRDDFRPDLEMVGWYHTHPGWSVFLSGMDLFICNNFFNRPLDVALVIDPCEQDRGWFQWTNGEHKTTQRTGGFVLTTGRYRQLELDQFARFYNKEPIMTLDPRYSGNSLAGNQPPVTMMNQRNPVLETAVVGMLFLQFMLMALLAWKLVLPGSGQANKVAELESKLDSATSAYEQSMRESAYRDVLGTIVSNQTGEPNLFEKYTELSTANQRLQANIEGQLALTEKLGREKTNALAKLNSTAKDAKSLETQLVKTRMELKEKKDALTALEDESSGKTPLSLPWYWAGLGGAILAIGGTLFGRTLGRNEAVDEPVEGRLNPGGSIGYDDNPVFKVNETNRSEPIQVVARQVEEKVPSVESVDTKK